MVVQHNISAMTANRYYGVNNKGLASSLEKLASGYAINKAGDNAAGLAVSEKMRAQIGGLTQASKNAEDGISMVQTFEGALQETDSILQRMRTLAVQSANGSYQDDVDREAMQLEFDQLNDELNQIADTDYNGTVVLNGGQMADGLKAVNGKFDYSKASRDAKQLSSNDVNLIDGRVLDNAETTNGTTRADTVWGKLNSAWSRTSTSTNKGPDSVDLTFEYDATNKTWSCTNASNGADYTKVTTTSTNNGGFKILADSVDAGDVVVDQSSLKNGDTITLTLNNPAVSTSAPTKAGAEVAYTTNFKEGDDAAAKKEAALNDLSVTINTTNVTDAKMSNAINSILDAFDGAQVTQTYSASAKTTKADTQITLSDGTVYSGGDEATYTLADGTNVKIGTDDTGLTTVKTSDDKEILKIQAVAQATDPTATAKLSSGSITFNVGIEHNAYDQAAKPSLEIKEPSGNVSISNAFDQSKATMTYADSMTLQVGARTKDEVNFTFSYSSNGLGDLKANMNCSARTDGLGTADLSIKTQKDANAAIDKIDNAINKISMVRGTFGAIQNRLEHKISNIDTNTENLTAAESRIRDTQMDKEMMKFTSNQILSQASQSMLAQANQLPQGVLQLLG